MQHLQSVKISFLEFEAQVAHALKKFVESNALHANSLMKQDLHFAAQ
jgi:hypothetical protein